MQKNLLYGFVVFGLLANSAIANANVSSNGRLVKCGNKLCGELSGEPVQVKGPSFFWSTPVWGGNVFFKTETVNALVDGWNASLIRAPLAVTPGKLEDEEANGWGYEDKPDENWSLVETVVDAAIAKDVYAIVDWHSHYAHEQTEIAIDFFTNKNRAGKYCNVPNVIYEIYNEPVEDGAEAWTEIKTYANALISAIRNKSCNNLILVGTPSYSANPAIAVNNLPTDTEDNFALVFHFYADAHKIDSKAWFSSGTYRSVIQNTLNAGIPVFVSEWGTNDARESGLPNFAEADKWHAFLDLNKISSAAWAVYNANVLSLWNGINPLTLDKIFNTKDLSNWTNPNYMSPNGRYIYRWLTGKDTTTTGQGIEWPQFIGETSPVTVSEYYGWADENKGASFTIDGGNFSLNLSNGDWAGFGTWFGSGKLGKCQYGVAYSYRGAAHVFQVVNAALEEFASGRALERANDWTKVDHIWSYFTDVDRNSLQEFGWNISASDVNKNKDSLQIKDVLCLESGTLPIRLPQIATANRVMQVHNGVNLHTANGAVVEIFSLKGNLIGRQNFGGGAHAMQLGHLPKGMYIIKVSFGSEKKVLRVPVR